MSSDRIYSDAETRATSDKVDPNQKMLEAMAALHTDIQKVDETLPPTRMQKKFKRLFGSGAQATQTFMTGFTMGAGIGGAFGGIIGTYSAI